MSAQKSPSYFSSESLYQFLFQPILSKDNGIDPEDLTKISLTALQQLSLYRTWPGISQLLSQLEKELRYEDYRLEQKLFNCHFKNPIGLAAGFDKNGVAAGIWDHFGFGFAELGTVTWHAQPGNPKPRLFRLAQEQAALNRMGFNNDGAIVMNKTLKKQNIHLANNHRLILGINLGKSKITPLESAPDDYATSLELLGELSDYVVINVSSPNTPGLRSLQEPEQLRRIIKRLRSVKNCPPLLVKIAPDLNDQAICTIAQLALYEKLDGLIAVNTSMDRLGLENRVISQTGKTLAKEDGGLSGSPLCKRALEVIRLLRKYTESKIILIGVGGIDSPQNAWERLVAGASLVQIYTGWIFKGPQLVPDILKGLSNQLSHHGFQNISEAIGSNAPWEKP